MIWGGHIDVQENLQETILVPSSFYHGTHEKYQAFLEISRLQPIKGQQHQCHQIHIHQNS